MLEERGGDSLSSGLGAEAWAAKLSTAADEGKIELSTAKGKSGPRTYTLRGQRGVKAAKEVVAVSKKILTDQDLSLEELSSLEEAHHKLYEKDQQAVAAIKEGDASSWVKAVKKHPLLAVGTLGLFPTLARHRARKREKAAKKRVKLHKGAEAQVSERKAMLQEQLTLQGFKESVASRASLTHDQRLTLLNDIHDKLTFLETQAFTRSNIELQLEYAEIPTDWADELRQQLNRIDDLELDAQKELVELASHPVMEDRIGGGTANIKDRLIYAEVADKIQNRQGLSWQEKADLAIQIDSKMPNLAGGDIPPAYTAAVSEWGNELRHTLLAEPTDLSMTDLGLLILVCRSNFVPKDEAFTAAIKRTEERHILAVKVNRLQQRNTLDLEGKRRLASDIKIWREEAGTDGLSAELQTEIDQWAEQVKEQFENFSDLKTTDEMMDLLDLVHNNSEIFKISEGQLDDCLSIWEARTFGSILTGLETFADLSSEQQLDVIKQMEQIPNRLPPNYLTAFGTIPRSLYQSVYNWTSHLDCTDLDDKTLKQLFQCADSSFLFTYSSSLGRALTHRVGGEISRRELQALTVRLKRIDKESIEGKLEILDEFKRMESAHIQLTPELNSLMRDYRQQTGEQLAKIEALSLQEQSDLLRVAAHPVICRSDEVKKHTAKAEGKFRSALRKSVKKDIAHRQRLNHGGQVKLLGDLSLFAQWNMSTTELDADIEEWQQEVRDELKTFGDQPIERQQELLELATHSQMERFRPLAEELLLVEVAILEDGLAELIEILPNRGAPTHEDPSVQAKLAIAIRHKMLREIGVQTNFTRPSNLDIEGVSFSETHFANPPQAREVPDVEARVDLEVVHGWVSKFQSAIPDPFKDEGSVFPREAVVRHLTAHIDKIIKQQKRNGGPEAAFKTPVNALSHFILHVQKEQARIDGISSTSERKRAQDDLDVSIKQVLIENIAPTCYHCIDRLNLEYESIYFQRVDTTGPAGESLPDRIEKKAAALRADIFEAIVAEVADENLNTIWANDIASFLQVARQQTGEDYGLARSTGPASDFTRNLIADVKRLTPEIKKRFQEQYTPRRVADLIGESVTQPEFHDWMMARFNEKSLLVEDTDPDSDDDYLWESPYYLLLNGKMTAPGPAGIAVFMQENGIIPITV